MAGAKIWARVLYLLDSQLSIQTNRIVGRRDSRLEVALVSDSSALCANKRRR